MADSSVQQSGGDFTTLASALADAGTGDGDTITIEGLWTIDDTAPCTVADDTITIQIIGFNVSYHDGVYNESNNHYRLVVADGNHVITVSGSPTVIDGLAIVQDQTGGSDEGIRMADAGTLTVKNCIVKANASGNDQDGIYINLDGNTLNVENVICYNWGRAGIMSQIPSSGTQTVNINCYTGWNCATVTDEANGGGISLRHANPGSVTTANIFNSCCAGAAVDANSDDFNEVASGSTITWNIDNCIDSDGSITDRDSGAVDPHENITAVAGNPAASEVGFISLTGGSEDLTLFDDATDNEAQDAHSATSGAGLSLPTLDIALVTRDTATNKVDIGAHAFAAAVVGAALPPYGQVIFNSADEENRPRYGQRIARATEE